MKNNTNNIKKGDFVRTIFAPNVFLCIDEEVTDLDTKEIYYWATDEDGGDFEVILEEIVEVIRPANNEGVKNNG